MAATICGLTWPFEHHAGDVDGLGVGDAQPVAELGHLAEPVHQVADLRAAAVDHDRAACRRSASARCPGRTAPARRASLAAPASALPPYFTTTTVPDEAPDVRQRLDEHVRPCRRRAVALTGTARPWSRPGVSGRPSATFIDCTAPPDAPLVRLSMAAMAMTQPVRASYRAVRCAALVPSVALVDGDRSPHDHERLAGVDVATARRAATRWSARAAAGRA